MTLVDALRARRRIAPYLRRTPLVRSAWLSDITKARVSLKLESLQLSSSFKTRGAFNAVIARMERGLAPGTRIVTASAGNHGLALAVAAEAFGLPLVVFAPADAPRTKLEAIRRHGATLQGDASDYDEAERLAKTFARTGEAVFISPYSDADVIAGAATIALEVFEEEPGATAIVVPVGGGGLISGIAAASKRLSPTCEVVGVEAEASSPFQAALRAGRIVTIVPRQTLADGLGGNIDPETITFEYIKRFVDRLASVSEIDLSAAIVGLIESEHLVAEGAGAAAAAALVGRHLDLAGRDVVVIVSGANIDRERLASVLRPAN